MKELWVVAGNLALVYAALTTTAVVVVYAFTKFEKTQVGRQFMLTKASLAVVLLFGAINILFVRPPTYTPTTPWRVFIYGVIGTIMLRWFVIIFKTQRSVRRRRHPVWDAPEEPPPVRRET